MTPPGVKIGRLLDEGPSSRLGAQLRPRRRRGPSRSRRTPRAPAGCTSRFARAKHELGAPETEVNGVYRRGVHSIRETSQAFRLSGRFGK